ncbi:hypothetical protein CEUSTIGMA_g10777.t1 [Chlamydomonas eustigma]|uniref:Uncharacterized protein n=1 Tax=Chlamydomonas eustigma TaxID=1157962 RepID=A0A250XKA3_9CHLO|nr:hypothetical protein CEUSTIGMA_g10777.t1 [Chlamydomonas eustigma]|eukprot:GAX83352.1 hypothetical protein CEUSTIGMA_g10777.t1 [Chlamydomonas eustigma]
MRTRKEAQVGDAPSQHNERDGDVKNSDAMGSGERAVQENGSILLEAKVKRSSRVPVKKGSEPCPPQPDVPDMAILQVQDASQPGPSKRRRSTKASSKKKSDSDLASEPGNTSCPASTSQVSTPDVQQEAVPTSSGARGKRKSKPTEGGGDSKKGGGRVSKKTTSMTGNEKNGDEEDVLADVVADSDNKGSAEEDVVIEEEIDLDASIGYSFNETMDPPAELLMPLLPYQKQFLAWAMKQERGTVKGGILADEMGMGKTIQAISIIVTHRDDDMAFVFDGSEAALKAAATRAAKDAAAAAAAAMRPRISLMYAAGDAALQEGAEPFAAATVISKESYSAPVLKPAPSQQQDPPVKKGRKKAVSKGKPSSLLSECEEASCLSHEAKPPPSSDLTPAGLPGSEKMYSGQVNRSCHPTTSPDTGALTVGSGTCPHLKAGKKLPEGTRCQECLREQAPAAQVQEGLHLYSKATLVICPVVAIIQWTQEIARFTAPGALKVLVYHGAKRSTSVAELEAADVVLTTYSTIENEFRRFMMPSKVCCKYCNRRFYPERLKVHLRFFCGPNAMKSEALAKQQKKRPRAGSSGVQEEEDVVDITDDEVEDLGPSSSNKKGQKSSRGQKAKTFKKKGNKKNLDEEVLISGSGDDSDTEEEEGAYSEHSEGSDADPSGHTKIHRKGGPGKGAVAPKKKSGSRSEAVEKKQKGGGNIEGGISHGSRRKGGGKSKSAVKEFEEDESGKEEREGDDMKAGPSTLKDRRMAFKRWYMGGKKSSEADDGDGWADQAEREAQAMIDAAEEAAESKRGRESELRSILHLVKWRRIILDEAHNIKDRRCSTAKAVFKLDSKYKWALSGTPLQNRVTELYSLIRFLRLYPYSYYFCGKKGCGCSSLDFPFSQGHRSCENCQHGPMSHFCWWNRFVANPIKFNGYQGKGRSAMLLLKNKIMPTILLRRTKVQCADDLCLPPRTLILRKDRFDEREDDFYQALYTQSQAMFGAYVDSGTVLNNYAHIFDLLIRLRQAVCHPYLVVHSSTAPAHQVKALSEQAAGPSSDGKASVSKGTGSPSQHEATEAPVCGICHEDVEDVVVSACGHSFCRACLVDYIESAVRQAQCPTCKQALTVDLTGTGTAPQLAEGVVATAPVKITPLRVPKRHCILSRINLANFQTSTKIEALREEIHRMIERDSSSKALVFSQFTSMLALIQHRLEQVGIKVVKLDGGMSLDARDKVISQFSNDPEVRVFLMSLKAGGVALNLTVASHVMLMDPWWNPAVEAQAMDRIHRLGQYKPITVVRFVIGGTIEERILKLQEKKQLVFEGTVGRDMEALGRLTEDDLRFLFG